MAFMETSAYEKINVDKAFRMMIEEIYKKCQKNFEDNADEEEIGHGGDINLSIQNDKSINKKEQCKC